MKGKVFFKGDRHTNIQTHGHRNSITESAQWADSVKIMKQGGAKDLDNIVNLQRCVLDRKIPIDRRISPVGDIPSLCLFHPFVEST